MATHFSIHAWTIQWRKESGRLQSVGSQSQTRLSTHAGWLKQTKKKDRKKTRFYSFGRESIYFEFICKLNKLIELVQGFRM